MPKINQAGLDLIKSFEGCVLHAYPDPGTGGDPWTIGYGHTGPDVHPGMVITQAKAEQLLQNDLTSFEEAVNRLVSRNLTPNQFAALVSFAYNCGVGSLEESTLLRYVNAGKFQAAAGEFGRWVSGGSGPMPGLVRRRAAEAKLFLEK